MSNPFRDNYSGAIVFRPSPDEKRQQETLEEMRMILEETRKAQRRIEELSGGDEVESTERNNTNSSE